MATFVTVGLDVGAANDSDTTYTPGHSYSVQHCHNQFASDGDTITVPNGAFTWRSGVTLTKGVTLTGQTAGLAFITNAQGTFNQNGTENANNIITGLSNTVLLAVGWTVSGTNIPNGTTVSSIDSPSQIHISNAATGSGSVSLTFTSPTVTPAVKATSPTTASIVIQNLNFYIPLQGFQPNTTIAAYRTYSTSNPYSVIIKNCNFNGAQAYTWHINTGTNGIIISKCTFIGQGASQGLGGIMCACNVYGYLTSWNYPDTTGTLDVAQTNTGLSVPAGLNNSYIEDCNFYDATTGATDFEENARVVCRHCNFFSAIPGSHGQETGVYGVRQWELYNNNFYINLSSWTITANFTQPAVGSAVTVTISSGGTNLISGQWVCLGTYDVYSVSVIDATHLSLTNLGWPLGTAAGSTMVAGALNGPSGSTYPGTFGAGLFQARGGGGCVVTNHQTFFDGVATTLALADSSTFLTHAGDYSLCVFSINRVLNDGVGTSFWSEDASTGLGYPAPRQLGWGWANNSTNWGIGLDQTQSIITNQSGTITISGTLYYIGNFGPNGLGTLLDPIYFWNNSSQGSTNYIGLNPFSPNANPWTPTPNLSDFVKLNREYYTGTAKPGWSHYQYPHPLAGGSASTPGSGLTATADSSITSTTVGASGGYTSPANTYMAFYSSWFTAQTKAGAAEWSNASDTAYVRVATGTGGSGWSIAAYASGTGVIWNTPNLLRQPAVANASQTLASIGFCDQLAIGTGNTNFFVDVAAPIAVPVGISISVLASFTTY